MADRMWSMKWFTSPIRRLCRWTLRLPRVVSIPIGTIVVLAIGVGVYFVVGFYSYMQDDPEFCQSCHIMTESWDRWATSDHAEVGCHECHQQSMLESASQLLSFITHDYERVEKHAVVQDEACEDCHESGDPNWLQVAATAGHKLHADVENIACTTCHSISVHRFEPSGAICEVCHDEQPMAVEKMKDTHCPVCHDFLAEGDNPMPTRSACLDCHNSMGGEVSWSAEAPMQFDCGACHQPHQETQPMVDCLSCHAVNGYHLRGDHEATQCETCHEAHEWTVSPREACLTCHPGKSDHNPSAECGACHQFSGK